MMKSNRSLSGRFLRCISTSALLAVALVGYARADVLTSPSGDYKVGIDPLGSLYDSGTGIGFQRVSDGYDPIAPGTSRDAWGVAAGAVSGYSDPAVAGVSNLVALGPGPDFRASLLDDGSGPLLQIDHKFFFHPAADDNILQINVQISNLSPVDQHVMYSRLVDWDIAPSELKETITASALAGIAVDGTYNGFEFPSENADPLVPFAISAGAAGGFFGPADLGAGLLVDLGILKGSGFPNELRSKHFSLFYAISKLGQTEAQLRAEINYFSDPNLFGGTNNINAAALGVGGGLGENVFFPTVLYSGAAFAVPEPTSVAIGCLGALGALGLAVSRKARRFVLGRD